VRTVATVPDANPPSPSASSHSRVSMCGGWMPGQPARFTKPDPECAHPSGTSKEE
jgi:hypothetical protein